MKAVLQGKLLALQSAMRGVGERAGEKGGSTGKHSAGRMVPAKAPMSEGSRADWTVPGEDGEKGPWKAVPLDS